MNQRLIWNFEFSAKTTLALSALSDKKEGHMKWEIRHFWPGNMPIMLNAIDDSLLNLTNYKQKYKEDLYYLLPDCNYNIKKRHEQLLYKPLLKRADYAIGYGPKIILNPIPNDSPQAKQISPDLLEIKQSIEKKGMAISVKKEALIYKFPTNPKIKIELARLEIQQATYFSLCIEGKSLYLVETLAKHLLGEHISCEYVTFLKTIMKL